MKRTLIGFVVAGVVVLFFAASAVDMAVGHGGGGGGGHAGGGGGGHYSGYSGSHYSGYSGSHYGGYSGHYGESGYNRSYSNYTPHTSYDRGLNPINRTWNTSVTRPFNANRVGYYDHHAYNWYHGNWHDYYHWDHPWGYGPAAWWTAGAVAGAVAWDAPWRWGYWPYYNPYAGGVVGGGTTVDYSQPIAAATMPVDQTPDGSQQSQALDNARDAFSQGDYTAAMTQVNEAISANPNDTLPHELRGLILFATKQYKEAAAAVYAVLSAGPGWDWATMSSFYPDTSVYTSQLRALEQYGNEHPRSPDVRFLLAYQYMTCGHLDAAIRELKEAVKLNPKDQLSAQILGALTQDKVGAKPAPSATPPAPAKPVTAAGLVGVWTASRSDGASFALDLDKHGAYSWKYTMLGKSQVFSGAYSVADNLLILKQAGNPRMVGQVIPLSDAQFTFKLAGDNASDPGLTFSKK
jgi:Flp pilus assembly protein TadD